jgi:2-hydroxy-6-oxonona-2,4-dienedioate hydrolase/2-hydroxy-6-oxo-6-(2'-carboxyphenyl)-hexa-2,4-dienoate hydrolase
MSFWIDALGASVRYYDADGIRTRVIEAGDEGEAIVCMHGLSGHAESFIRNVVPLAAAGYRVFSVDAVGHGFSAKPEDVTYHSPLFERHLLGVLDAIGADQAHVIGQSLGGWTAWRLALAHPERFHSLISATGAGILLDDDALRKESEEIHKKVGSVTARALEEPTRERVRARLEFLMASPDRVTDELVETRYTIFNLPDSRRVMGKVNAEQTGEANRANLLREADLQATAVPTMLLWTDKNPTVPASTAERAAAFVPGARFEVIEDAGHWPQFERPAAFNEVVLDFFGSV